ncbi:MAG TPA: hypothetical protein VHC22_34230 [Pirellulales bacterium]|nr:hypothetical protein [Pirellulales bacterium]
MADIASNPRRFQFSIRVMLVATASVAAVVGAMVAEPSPWSCLALGSLSVLFASVSIMTACMSTGRFRAFWTWTAVPAFLGAVGVSIFIYPLSTYADINDDLSAIAELLRVGRSCGASR